MVRLSKYAPDYEVVPQAIFWRPLSYFAATFRTDEDELDTFIAASYVIDNQVNFDLRHYRGHPEHTVTVYLPLDIEDIREVTSLIELIGTVMAVPRYAIAWKRGWDFEYGSLKRREDDRLKESEARTLALKIAAQCPNHRATTEHIKQHVPRYYQPSEADLAPSLTRRGEARWQQIVGNVISHQETLAGPFKKGYAMRTEDGLSVTRDGLNYLTSIGFLA